LVRSDILPPLLSPPPPKGRGRITEEILPNPPPSGKGEERGEGGILTEIGKKVYNF